MLKRGQVTIFVILGLVILIILGIVYYVKFYILESKYVNIVPQDIQAVDEYVKNCLEQTVKEGLVYLGDHGGYFIEEIPYYYKNNVSLIEENFLNRELNNYINYRLNYCIKDFYYLSEYNIQENGFEVNSEINQNVNVLLDYKLDITKADKTYNLRYFNVVLNSNISKMFDIADFIVEDYALNGNRNCITCIYDKIEETNFDLYINYVDDGILYSLDNGQENFDWLIL
ncbi:hypothetical protein J4436_03815 [Candidatus Woesearchaeota archaeon]|nr:hypothetical protein [Candidatus Woesearchaeota archaeon]